MHEPAYRAAYFVTWRLNHPEYRERERQRMIVKRQTAYYERLRVLDIG